MMDKKKKVIYRSYKLPFVSWALRITIGPCRPSEKLGNVAQFYIELISLNYVGPRPWVIGLSEE